eukprot:7398448-Lingulodinium_polyedra.AAC.1
MTRRCSRRAWRCSRSPTRCGLHHRGARPHVIASCGRLHVEFCLTDPREEYALCDLPFPHPVVSYRVTVAGLPCRPSSPSRLTCAAASASWRTEAAC